MNETVFDIIRRKGIGESLFSGLSLLSIRSLSILRSIGLRLRGYRIARGVIFRGASEFQQSIRGSVRIDSTTIIGKNCRISAGFDGRIHIGERVLIDDSSMVMAQERIDIGSDTLVAPGCFIIDFDHNFSNPNTPTRLQGYLTKPVSIGKNVWIGTHCVILKGVSIGNGAIIGAGSVVTHDIPANAIAAGNPAQVIRSRK